MAVVHAVAWVFLFFFLVGVGHTIRWFVRGIRSMRSVKSQLKQNPENNEDEEDG